MDAIKFIKERDRMCKSYYDAEKGHCSDGCPAHDVQCTDLDDLSTDAEELVTLVEEWSATHPCKTRQSVFLSHYPEAPIGENGVLEVCPANVDANYRSEKGGCVDIHKRCKDCFREFWPQEVKE